MGPILVEWSGEPRIVGALPRTVVGTWSQIRRLEDAGIAHRERELVIIDDGYVRAMYRITDNDALRLKMDLIGESGEPP